MKNPKISIVICTYNDKNLVKRCLDSIFSQSYKNFEIICVDGGSKDGTLELLKKHKVKIINNKKRFPEGPGMGKSQGAIKAKGEIIAFIDQDNKLIGNNCLKELVFPLINDKEIFGVACKLYINKNDNITNRYLSYVGTDPFAVYRSLEGRMALNRIKLKDKGRYYTYYIKLPFLPSLLQFWRVREQIWSVIMIFHPRVLPAIWKLLKKSVKKLQKKP